MRKNRNVARMASLLAGLPAAVPGVTVNRLCGSGLEAVAAASRAIKAGEGAFYIAGGVESMSRAPFVIPKADTPFARESDIHATTIGWRFVTPRMKERYGVDPLGETAENVAAEYGISRTHQDAFALRSQRRAPQAQQNGRFAEEIVPVTARRGKEGLEIIKDEHPRPATTMEQLTKLRPSFRKDGSVTAGNSSGVTDGAAALIIASAKAVKEIGLTPRARVVAAASSGVEPRGV